MVLPRKHIIWRFQEPHLHLMNDKRLLIHGGTEIRPPPVRAITAPTIISISAHSGGSETNSCNVGDNEAGCFAGWDGAGVCSEEEAPCCALETEAGGAGRLAPIGATMDAGEDRGCDGPKLGGGAGVGVAVSCRNTTALVVAAKLPRLVTPLTVMVTTPWSSASSTKPTSSIRRFRHLGRGC